MKITYQSRGYAPADVFRRYVRAYGTSLYSFSEAGTTGLTIRSGIVSADEVPKAIRKEVDRLKGQAFSWVDWPLEK